MNLRLPIFLLSLVGGGLLAWQGRGVGQREWVWTLYSSSRQCPVEQQPIGNSTGSFGLNCNTDPVIGNPYALNFDYSYPAWEVPVWDADDSTTVGGGGVLAPGEQAELTFRVLSDHHNHLIGMLLNMDDQGGVVIMEIAVDRDGTPVGPSPWQQTVSLRGIHKMAVSSPEWRFGEQFSEELDEIPGSGLNGMENGKARLFDIHLRIKNVGSKTLRRSAATLVIAHHNSRPWVYPHGWWTDQWQDDRWRIQWDLE